MIRSTIPLLLDVLTPRRTSAASEMGQSLPSHNGIKFCDVRCWSDSCQKIAGPRVFAAAKQRRHSIKSSTQTDTSHSRNGSYGLFRRPLEFAESIWLGTGELDDLAPLLGFVRDELAEIGGRERKRRDAQVGKLRPELGIG